jgi:hypothetical protein
VPIVIDSSFGRTGEHATAAETFLMYESRAPGGADRHIAQIAGNVSGTHPLHAGTKSKRGGDMTAKRDNDSVRSKKVERKAKLKKETLRDLSPNERGEGVKGGVSATCDVYPDTR